MNKPYTMFIVNQQIDIEGFKNAYLDHCIDYSQHNVRPLTIGNFVEQLKKYPGGIPLPEKITKCDPRERDPCIFCKIKTELKKLLSKLKLKNQR